MMMRARFVLVLILGVWTAALNPTAVSTASVKKSAAKLDRHLQDLSANAAPGERARVIVTTRKGKRGEVMSALEHDGDAVLEEHSFIDAVTADVPVGRLQALAQRE